MQRIINHEWTKSVCLALMLLGVGALLFGFWIFLNNSQQIQDNLAYQVKQQQANSSETLQLQSSEAQALFSADLKLRDLERNRSIAVVVIGGGVILTAVGWLANDFVRSRRRAMQLSA
jgi:hypothetical protein